MKLLLDEHIWPGVAGLLRRYAPSAQVDSIHHYNGGSLINTTDEEILAAACRNGWTLVTFDLNTIPSLLREMAAAGENHGGVIFVSSKSFAQNDHARLAQALSAVVQSEDRAEWSNRTMYLARS